MKNIKTVTIIIMSVLVSATAFGQPKKSRQANKDKIRTMKIGYITNKLNLTPEEAQQFWPIYNEFDAKMEELHMQLRKMHKKGVSVDNMSDGEVEKMINAHTALRQKELDIQKAYHLKFKAVLPIKKIAKLYKAEEDFKRDLLKKLKNHKGGGPDGRPGPPPPR